MSEPTADPEESLRAAVRAGATDEDLLRIAAMIESGGRSVEQVVIEALLVGDVSDDLSQHRALIRWYRRAARNDQPWALWTGGRTWANFGSNGHLPPGDQLPVTEAVGRDEAVGWLARAADHGVRPAAMAAAERAPEDPRAEGWLRLAYGDGRPTVELDRDQLCAGAFRLASLLDRAGSDEARAWYRRAVEGPMWVAEEAFDQASWEVAAAGLADWAHRHQDEALCAAWCWRLVEVAANEGAITRAYLDSEWKTYRYAWESAHARSSALSRALRHLLAEHDLSPDDRWDIAALLSDLGPGRDDAGLITHALGDLTARMSLRMLIPPPTVPPVPGTEAPLNARQVWALTHWLLADAVPACFRFASLGPDAEAYGLAVPALPPESQDLLGRRLRHDFDGWSRLDGDGGTREEALTLAKDLLEIVGLSSSRSPYATDRGRGAPEYLAPGDEGTWRLLRGHPLWLAMFLAVTPEERESWVRTWDFAGHELVRALVGCARRLATAAGVDPTTRRDAELGARWRTLTDAFALALAEFVDAAVMVA